MLRRTIFYLCVFGFSFAAESSMEDKTYGSSWPVFHKVGGFTFSNFDQMKRRDGKTVKFHGLRKPLYNSPSDLSFYPETPGSLACVAGLTPRALGCDPMYSQLTFVQGGSQTIAIVIPFDNPTVSADLKAYDAYYGLQDPPSFKVIYATGAKPKYDPSPNGSSIRESAMDVEIAHAMAPFANIVLVEAASFMTPDLMKAVDVASALVTANGGRGEVSMSWTIDTPQGEVAGDSNNDSHFQHPGVVYIAASGDAPGVFYPGSSAYVVSVGGTQIMRDGAGNYTGQTAWPSTGGGISQYARPISQQANIKYGQHSRSVPDLSFVAALPGVWFYTSFTIVGDAGPWHTSIGTSNAAPAVAGIINSSGKFYNNTFEELDAIYANLGNSGAFFDMTIGSCGPQLLYPATIGYDLCTGVGAPVGTTGK